MAFALNHAFRFWGWNTQGDWGPYTFYTSSRKKLVFFAKAPPTTPASPLQRRERNQFLSAAFFWRSLTADQRADWERASRKASLRIHGFNLFVAHLYDKTNAVARTIARQTGIDLAGLDLTLR